MGATRDDFIKYPHAAPVRLDDSQCLTANRSQQGEAIAAGREIARNQHSELRIEGRDGKVREIPELRQ